MANTNSNFTPTGSDWKTIVIGPGSFSNYLVSDFRFKFKFVNGSGSVSINQLEKVFNFSVYPNPVLDKLIISFSSLTNLTDPFLEIMDGAGRIINLTYLNNFSKGQNNLEISSSNLESGWYIIKIISNEKSFATKFLKL